MLQVLHTDMHIRVGFKIGHGDLEEWIREGLFQNES